MLGKRERDEKRTNEEESDEDVGPQPSKIVEDDESDDDVGPMPASETASRRKKRKGNESFTRYLA